MSKTTYKIRIEGESDPIEVEVADFYERNQALAIAYKTENEQNAKSEIAAKILKLCEPVFKAWKITDSEDREDFKQDCFFIVLMALDSFNPHKGAFISWLRGYASGKLNKTLPNTTNGNENRNSSTLRNKEIPISKIGEDEKYLLDTNRQPWDEEPEQESGFGRDLERAKALIGEERFNLVRQRVILGMNYDEIASEMGLSIPTVKKKLSLAYEALRTGTALNIDTGSLLTNMEDGSIFITLKQLALRLGKKERQLYQEAKGTYKTRYKINPLHILRIGRGLRFRYKVSAKGLEYPEFILKGKVNPKPNIKNGKK